MATWQDLEKEMGSIESLDRQRLEELSVVQPQSSHNPAYHAKFQQAQLRISRALAKYAEADRRAEETERHFAIERRLTELKNPHWTVRPNFWFTVVGAVSALAAALFAWIAFRSEAPSPPASIGESLPSSAHTQPTAPQEPLK